MFRILLVCALVVSATISEGEAMEKRSLGELAAGWYQNAIGTVLPEATQEACKGLGWIKGPNARRRRAVGAPMVKRGLLDSLIPSGLSKAIGAFHQEVFPASMEASFCTQAGMVKPQPPGPVIVIQQAAAPQGQTISGTWADINGMQVLVTPQGEVWDANGNYLGTAAQFGFVG